MDGRIGRLNCRCKVLGSPQSAGVLQSRLERLAREQFAKEYDAAIQSALGDDPSVYVLRRVRSRMTLVLDSATPDRAAARGWGERAAQAAVRVIAREAEGENLVRFDHQADYVAHFIVDLIEGYAWERWFYGAFSALQPLPTRDALLSVLEENRTDLPAILACLQREGGVEPLLAALDDAGRRWLWAQACGDLLLEQAGARSLLNASLDLFDRLGLWQSARPDADTFLTDYLAGRPAPVDWRDPQGLADGMLDVARALRRGGLLRIAVGEPGLAERLREALAGLDWLDGERLAPGLLALLRPVSETGVVWAGFDLPVRAIFAAPGAARPAVRRLTPRQRRLLETLRDLFDEDQVRLAPGVGQTEGNALRLYSALVARDEGWNGDALALETIQRLVESWQWLRDSGAGDDLLQRLARGEGQSAQGMQQTVMESLAALGEPGAEALRAMLRERGRRAPGGEEVIETQCAGAALLLRALADARIAWLYHTSGYAESQPGLDGLVLALAQTWAGTGGQQGEEIDAGLRSLAGLVARPAGLAPLLTASDLRTRWQDAPSSDSWQTLWLRLLAGQRLLQPEALLLYRLVRGGDTLLVAGDASGSLWPFGAAVQSERETVLRAAAWLETWQQVSGAQPRIVAGEGTLAAGEIGGQPVLRPELSGDLAEVYQAGCQRLSRSLDELAKSTLRLAAWNLTLALTANGLLRLWARWLRGFGDASVPYLLSQFIHRPGRLITSADRLTVELEPRPLDAVLHLSGYLSPLAAPWLGERTLYFQIRGAE